MPNNSQVPQPGLRTNSSQSSDESAQVSVAIEDSGTESGEDLRLIAAGLCDSIEQQRIQDKKTDTSNVEPLNPGLLSEVLSALSRLQTSLQLGSNDALDSTRKLGLLQLVNRLQTSLIPTPSGPTKVVEKTLSRFAKRKDRKNRHTIGVSNEEIADARRLMEEIVLRDSLKSEDFGFPIQKQKSDGSVISNTPYKPIQNSVAKPFQIDSSKHNIIYPDGSSNLEAPDQKSPSIEKSLEESKPIEDFVVNDSVSDVLDLEDVSSAQRLLHIAQDMPKPINRYYNKKNRMKRANTIDIPKLLNYNVPIDDDSDSSLPDQNRKNNYLALRGPIRLDSTKSNVPSFEPKTDSDKKFLAFIKSHEDNNSKVTTWMGGHSQPTQPEPPQPTKQNWNNNFGNIRTLFEHSDNSRSSSTQSNSARKFWENNEQNKKFNSKVKSNNHLRNVFEQKTSTQGNILTSHVKIDPQVSQEYIPKPVPVNQFSHNPMSAFKPIPKRPQPQYPVQSLSPNGNPPRYVTPGTAQSWTYASPRTVETTKTSLTQPFMRQQSKSPINQVPWSVNSGENRVMALAASKFEIPVKKEQSQPQLKFIPDKVNVPAIIRDQLIGPSTKIDKRYSMHELSPNLNAPYLVQKFEHNKPRKLSGDSEIGFPKLFNYHNDLNSKIQNSNETNQVQNSKNTNNFKKSISEVKKPGVSTAYSPVYDEKESNYSYYDQPNPKGEKQNKYKAIHSPYFESKELEYSEPKSDSNYYQKSNFESKESEYPEPDSNYYQKPKFNEKENQNFDFESNANESEYPESNYYQSKVYDGSHYNDGKLKNNFYDDNIPDNEISLINSSMSTTPQEPLKIFDYPSPELEIQEDEPSEVTSLSLTEYKAVAKVMKGPVGQTAVTVTQNSSKKHQEETEMASNIRNSLQKFKIDDKPKIPLPKPDLHNKPMIQKTEKLESKPVNQPQKIGKPAIIEKTEKPKEIKPENAVPNIKKLNERGLPYQEPKVSGSAFRRYSADNIKQKDKMIINPIYSPTNTKLQEDYKPNVQAVIKSFSKLPKVEIPNKRYFPHRISTESHEYTDHGDTVISSKLSIPVADKFLPQLAGYEMQKTPPKVPSPTHKNEAWNQITQQANKPSPRGSPRSRYLIQKAKSSHSLAIPSKQFEAGIPKEDLLQKKLTVEAYFAGGKKSPNPLSKTSSATSIPEKVQTRFKQEKITTQTKFIGHSLSRSQTMPQVSFSDVSLLDESNVDAAFEDLFNETIS